MNPTLAQQPYRLESILNSSYRFLIDTELHKILKQLYHHDPLIINLYYHLQLDDLSVEATIEHSKRLRGILCLLISEGLGVNQAHTLPVACAIELYHNASLIYDDIQDGSKWRCGRLALWRKVGIAEAINTAILLETTAEYILLEHSTKDRYYFEAFHELVSAKAHVVRGQNRDLQSQKHWHEGTNYYYKTSRLKTGALLGTALVLGALGYLSHRELQVFREFGESLGLAHQIEDDIDDLISFQNGMIKQLDTGNIIYFLASELGLLKKDQQGIDCMVNLVNEPSFWLELQKKRENMQRRLTKSISNLPSITDEVRVLLLEIAHALCHRNDLAMSKIATNQRIRYSAT